MSVVVFAGPSISAPEIRARLHHARVLPPAAAGDVLAATRTAPKAIGLVDGVFDGALPVWHKEILWALAEGVHVFGAASMGALRAAELDRFGIRGVGKIYAAYRDGAIDADDEVAVLHGPAEVGFMPLTEALVNVRATMAAAVAAGATNDAAAGLVIAAAAGLHYRERTWPTVLALLPDDLSRRLGAWLPAGRIDQKRLDALELLDELEVFARSDTTPFEAGFRFAWTEAWESLHRRVAISEELEEVLDELRLRPARYRAVRRGALARHLAAQSFPAPAEAARGREVERLRGRLALWRRADLEQWRTARALDEAGFGELAAEEALLERLTTEAGEALTASIIAELRLSDDFAELHARARRKRELAASADVGTIDPAPLLAELEAEVEVEAKTPSGSLARSLGFRDRGALTRAVLRELVFRRMITTSEDLARGTMSARPDSA